MEMPADLDLFGVACGNSSTTAEEKEETSMMLLAAMATMTKDGDLDLEFEGDDPLRSSQ